MVPVLVTGVVLVASFLAVTLVPAGLLAVFLRTVAVPREGHQPESAPVRRKKGFQSVPSR